MAGFLVCCVIGWRVFEYVVDVDRYRSLIVEKIVSTTGLPASIDDLDMAFIPLSVLADGVRVGQGDFQASVDHARMYVELGSLVRGRLKVNELTLSGLRVTTPAETSVLEERIVAVRAHAQRSQEDRSAPLEAEVDEVRVRRAQWFLAGRAEPLIVCDLTARNVLSPSIPVEGRLRAPIIGDRAKVDVNVTVNRYAGAGPPFTVDGTIRLNNLDVASLKLRSDMPSVTLDAEAVLDDAAPPLIGADLTGTATPEKGFPLLAGKFTGKARWDSGAVTVNDLEWEGRDLQLVGNLTWSADAGVACDVAHAHMTGNGLGALFAYVSADAFTPAAGKDAEAEAKGLLLGVRDGGLHLVKGTVSFKGIDLTLRDKSRTVKAVRGQAVIEEGVIRLQEITGAGMTLRGEVAPNLTTREVAINLQGHGSLTKDLLALWMPVEAIREAQGKTTLKSVKATFRPKGGLPKDLRIEGEVAQGRLALTTTLLGKEFTNVSGRFEVTPAAVTGSFSAASESWGPVQLNAQYRFDGKPVEGAVSTDLDQWRLAPLPNETAQALVPAALKAYGPSRFNVTLDMPSAAGKRWGVRFARAQGEKLEGMVTFAETKEGWSLADVQVTGRLPAGVFAPVLPAGVPMDGMALVTLSRDPKQQQFKAQVDLIDSSLRWDRYLEKRRGEPMAIRVTGEASHDKWSVDTLEVACLDESFSGRVENGRVLVDKLEIDVAALSKLFPSGTTARGRISGSFATSPTVIDLTLDKVGAVLSPELSFDSISGGVQYRDGKWNTQGLALRTAHSECTADIAVEDGVWQGSIKGRRLDVNAVEKMIAATKAFQKEPPAGTEDGADSKPFKATFLLDVASVLYGRARLDDVRAEVAIEDGTTTIRNLAAKPYAGKMSGTIQMTFAKEPGGRGTTAVDLQFESADARIVDDFVFSEPRQLTGVLSGMASLQFPTGEGVNAAGGANGTITFTGRKGSFGKLGLATKVLTAMRSVEIVRLRLPSRKDEGLSYDTCAGKMTMDNGVLTVHEMTLKNPTYEMTAGGTIDFARDNADLIIRVNLLETFTGVAELVPVLRDAVREIERQGGLRLSAKGALANPSVRVLPAQAVERATEGLGGAVRTGTDILKDGLGEAAGRVLRDVLTLPQKTTGDTAQTEKEGAAP